MTSDNIAINSSNFSVDKNGNITSKSGTIGGFNITSSAIYKGKNSYQSSTDGIFLGPSGIACGNMQFSSSNGGMFVYSTSDNSISSFRPGHISITPDNDGGLYINEYNNDVSSAYLSANTSGGNLYLRGGTPGSSIETIVNYDGITTPTVTQTSKEEDKKNFTKLENGLDIIKDIDIYKYNLKVEEDDTKKHIGFVIGDNFNYSKEITSKDNDGVDVYSFVSVCCKAIQEQQEEIEMLKNEIKELKGGK